MTKKNFLIFLISFGCFTVSAQKKSGKVFSKDTNQPIENVAIATNLNTGTISDKSGNFNLDLKNVKTITFSFLGYATKIFSIDTLRKQNFTVYLAETVNQLDEIELTIASISLDSLLIKTIDSMNKNYYFKPVQQNFYAIENQKMEFPKLELDLKSSSILSRKNRKLAQNELEQFSNQIQDQNPEFSKEFNGVLSSKKITNKKTNKEFRIYKIDTVIGYKKNEIIKNLTIHNIQEKLQTIVLKHLNKDKTYKIKTGLFKIKDSLSFKKVSEINDSIEKDNSYNEPRITDYKRETDINGLFLSRKNEFNFFNRKYYNHKLEKNEFLGTQKYYVISFDPRKSKAKFAGKVYINSSDFTFKKVIYKYAKGRRGDHINLKWALGIKYSENEKSSVLFYEKEKTGKVYTSYYKNSFKNYAYIDRPIKFIENSKEKEKVKFNIKVEVVVSENIETLLYNTEFVKKESIRNYTKEDFIRLKKYISEKEYELSQWKNRNLIEKYLKNYE